MLFVRRASVLFVSGVRRRNVMRGLFAVATALALAPVVTASRNRHSRHPAHPGSTVLPPGHTAPSGGIALDEVDVAFDETYCGCRIRGGIAAEERATAMGARWQVTVDGRPLHLMRRADGTYLSMVDHYRSYPTALEATRAAVDELGPAQRLRVTDAVPGGRHRKNGHRESHERENGHRENHQREKRHRENSHGVRA
ncbi:tyrosinase cofactor [Streptomyces poonensis]|uniref:Tyrosinase n=1 Tax=Streptomyces poonensis TaxID=68255 RepID=A0A918PPD0_9ACTN|nr:tyrosinase cofactor [Streptomyces poonensis]GGZ17874.1 tyrosinase [Streptomyces poonensis]GLJ91021.1 tyrosinase [Streptomyces poonensis]